MQRQLKEQASQIKKQEKLNADLQRQLDEGITAANQKPSVFDGGYKAAYMKTTAALTQSETNAKKLSEENKMLLDKLRQNESFIDGLKTIENTMAIKNKLLENYHKVDMADRGIDKLNFGDREVLEKAFNSLKIGEDIKKLFNGEQVTENERTDESKLITSITVFTSDKEQALRIFKASGQYREGKTDFYYEKLINNSIMHIEINRQARELHKQRQMQQTIDNKGKNNNNYKD